MSSRSLPGIRIVLCLFFILFLGVADSLILSPLLPAIQLQFARPASDMGFLFTGYSFAAGLSVLIWGPLSDAQGRKKGVLSGLVIFILGSTVSYLSSSFIILLTGRILTGMGSSMLSLNSISYAADFFPYAKRGWAMGSIVSSYFAALILGVPLGSWLGDVFGWNLVFGTLGAIALALLISTYFTLPTFNPGQHKTISGILPAEELRKYFGFLKAQKTAGALLSSFFASAGTVGFLTFVGVWLNGSFGISSSQIGLVFLVCGAAALVASPLAGSLSDRIGKRRQFVISSLFLALFLVVLPRLRWGPALFAVFGVISLSAALRQGPMEALLTQVVSPMSRGSFIALKNSFSQLGIGLAAMLSGMLFQWGGYSPVCILGAISNLLAAVGMLLMVRERYL